jgi:hypothetical protein
MGVVQRSSISKSSTAGRIAILLILSGVLLSACSNDVQLAGGASEVGVKAAVDSCKFDPAIQSASEDVTVTSTRPHLLVSLSGTMNDQSGAVVGQGSATVGNVQPGQAYHATILFSLDATPTGAVTCKVAVDQTA